MNKLVKMTLKPGGAALAAILLAACGGSGGGFSGTGSGDSDTGSFSLGITDGPVDEADNVFVQFDGVEIQPADGELITFAFDSPQSIDLLALQGDASESLLTNETVPAGDYEWIRLMVSAESDMVFDSYIVDGTGQHELWIPSGAQTGLKLVSGFTVAAGGASDFTIDFDLRKSVTDPPGLDGYILRPALRLINNQLVGTLSGSIDSSLISAACDNPTENDGAVYLYTGTVETAEDIRGAETDPLTTALVDDSDWTYEIGFLEEGQYSAAFTCDNEMDDPAVDDELTFHGLTTVEITADTETVVDFAAE